MSVATNHGIQVILLLLPLVNCFNLEPRSAIVFTKPKLPTDSEERPSYFGFSVALLKSNADNKTWLMVGGPRGNSSMYPDGDSIIEPGAFYKCDVSNEDCQEVLIDPDGDQRVRFGSSWYHDMKSYGWLGSSLDSQPDKRQATVVCAGRLKNQERGRSICGRCYWLNSSLTWNDMEHELTPLIQQNKQIHPVTKAYWYAHGLAGMAAHFPKDVNNTQMLIGAPGVLKSHGTVIRYKDLEYYDPGGSNRKRRQINRRNSIEQNMFTDELVPDPYQSPNIAEDDLFGYAVSSGRLEKGSVYYVGGSPRGANSRGKVLVFEFPYYDGQIIVKQSLKGSQIGEYFGASVAMLDADGDGVDELVVGAPQHALPNKPDVGKIYYYHNINGYLKDSKIQFVGSGTSKSRFATTLAVLGDLNSDGFEDLAVGAPWEDAGIGAVYIYLGSNKGLRAKYSQRLSPDQFGGSDHHGFGMALSRGVDIDGNYYPDLGVGSFLSGHAVLIRSRPIVSITPMLKATPSKITLNGTSLNLKACIDCSAKYSTKDVKVNITLSLDHSFTSPRATFRNGSSTETFEMTLPTAVNSKQKCRDFDIKILEEKKDYSQPLRMKMEYRLIDNYISPEQIISEPIIDIYNGEDKEIVVGIVTGCEGDGNDTCSTDLRVNATFKDYGIFSNYTVGSKSQIPLSIKVTNVGEPAFLPNLTVSVDDPLKLYMPKTHFCLMPEKFDGKKLFCNLNNPLDTKDELTVNVDVSRLKDQKSEVNVNVKADSAGNEIEPTDNSQKITLNLNGKASLQILGYSRDEQLIYHIDKNGIINTTTDSEVLHVIQILKKGPTPISNVELNIDIPTNISYNSLSTNFLQMALVLAEFGDQQVICSLEGVVLTNFDKHITGPINNPVMRNNSERSRLSKKSEQTTVTRDFNTVSQSEDPTLHLSCDRSGISCARVSCPIGPWFLNSDSVLLHLRIKLNLSIVAEHMSKLKGAVLISRVETVIRKNTLSIEGDSVTENVIRTPIIPSMAESLGIPWWYILLAILAGVLLLGIMSYALYKSGFFKRAKKDEMTAHKATVKPTDTTNLVEND